MKLENLPLKTLVELNTIECQKQNHTQQVAYSTYHNALTQVCFTCDCVRTNIDLSTPTPTKEDE